MSALAGNLQRLVLQQQQHPHQYQGHACVNLRHFRSQLLSTKPFASDVTSRYGQQQQPSVAAGAFGSVDGSTSFGPPLPPKRGAEPPPIEVDMEDWVQDLINDAPYDDEVAELLQGTDNDPEKIREKMRASMESKHKAIYASTRLGSDTPMRVRFREVDPTNLWLWFRLYSPPSEREKKALEEVLQGWFMMGRLGGFNGMNLQVFHHGEDDASYFDYNTGEAEETLEAFMHEMGPLESRGEWARVWVDMGTSDELAIDVLINAMCTLSRENLGIRMLVVGGENEEWPAPKRADLDGSADPMRAALEMMRGMKGAGSAGGGGSNGANGSGGA